MHRWLIVTLTLLGPASAAAGEILDLGTTAADVEILGRDPKDWSAKAVLLADLDDDGFDDLVIGAQEASSVGNVRINAGEVYVFYGRPDLAPRIDLAATDPDAILLGGPAGDRFGGALAAGDLDGDGAADLIVGAPRGHGPALRRSEAGQVYVFLGGRPLPREWDVAVRPADMTVYGLQNSQLGWRLLTADLDGDPFDDLVIAATGNVAKIRAGGQVHVFHGKAELPPVIDLRTAVADRTYGGSMSNDALGRALAAADFDGDGLDDLVITALRLNRPGHGGNGAAHLFLSGRPRPAFVDTEADPGDWLILGGVHSAWLGNGVAAGDFTGDGIPDLALGSPRESPVPTLQKAGRVRILSGTRRADAVTDLSVEAADVVLISAIPLGRLGWTLAAADVDRDGVDDLLADSYVENFDRTRPWAGVVRLLRGGAALTGTLDLASYAVDLTVLGRWKLGTLGSSMATGDWNGDGGVDIVLGAPLGPSEGHPRQFAGEAYVLLGRSPCSLPLDSPGPPWWEAPLVAAPRAPHQAASRCPAPRSGAASGRLRLPRRRQRPLAGAR